jgi:hypothetical protein
MYNWILLLNIFLVTWFLTNHDKIVEVVDNSYLYVKSKLRNKILIFILNNLHEVVSCHKCLSFFSTLFITLNPFQALLVSFVAWLVQKNNPF